VHQLLVHGMVGKSQQIAVVRDAFGTIGLVFRLWFRDVGERKASITDKNDF